LVRCSLAVGLRLDEVSFRPGDGARQYLSLAGALGSASRLSAMGRRPPACGWGRQYRHTCSFCCAPAWGWGRQYLLISGARWISRFGAPSLSSHRVFLVASAVFSLHRLLVFGRGGCSSLLLGGVAWRSLLRLASLLSFVSFCSPDWESGLAVPPPLSSGFLLR
jgi:hypothetical protein